MKADLMVWMQRLVVLVLLAGLAGLCAAGVLLMRQGTALPVMQLAVLVSCGAGMMLLAAAVLAMMAMAREARRGADALRRLSQGGAAPLAAPVQARAAAQGAVSQARPFVAQPVHIVAPEPEPVVVPEPEPVPEPRVPRPASARPIVAQR